MCITIENRILSLTVDTKGAQMMHLQSGDTEYLWQGDPQYWADRAPNLFPFIGRLTNDSYRLGQTVYPMSIHGFASSSEFAVVEKGKEHLVMELTDCPETRKQYPFAFILQIIYRLVGSRIEITYRVENRSTVTMPFGIGGHPGFRVPLEDEECFEDYSITFSQPCQPDRVGFTPTVYLSSHDERYPLAEDTRLDLHHGLFDEDAIILKNIAREVTLQSRKSGKGVRVTFPHMPYLGIWHWPKTDAPYVCIEPWSSLPSRQNVVEDFYCKSDMIQLEPGHTYTNTWSITLIQEADSHD